MIIMSYRHAPPGAPSASEVTTHRAEQKITKRAAIGAYADRFDRRGKITPTQSWFTSLCKIVGFINMAEPGRHTVSGFMKRRVDETGMGDESFINQKLVGHKGMTAVTVGRRLLKSYQSHPCGDSWFAGGHRRPNGTYPERRRGR